MLLFALNERDDEEGFQEIKKQSDPSKTTNGSGKRTVNGKRNRERVRRRGGYKMKLMKRRKQKEDRQTDRQTLYVHSVVAAVYSFLSSFLSSFIEEADGMDAGNEEEAEAEEAEEEEEAAEMGEEAAEEGWCCA